MCEKETHLEVDGGGEVDLLEEAKEIRGGGNGDCVSVVRETKGRGTHFVVKTSASIDTTNTTT